MDERTITTGGITFINVNKFENWLCENLRRGYHASQLHEWLDDLDRQTGESGSTEYELSSHMTISGKPECISFERENVWNEDGEDLVETIITF